MPTVVSCPNCEKKLAVKDQFKGRSLICPQCKRRFTVPADDVLVLGVSSAPSDGGMGFLDGLGPSSARPAKSVGSRSTTGYSPRTAVGGAARSAERAKMQAAQKQMILIGVGIALGMLVIVAAAILLNLPSSAPEKAKEAEDIRFGLPERTRIELFQKFVSAVDRDGITKTCKERWYRLADEYKLDHGHIKDILDEGFSFKNDKWALPEATSTAQGRAVRMDWVRQRTAGSDPILAM